MYKYLDKNKCKDAKDQEILDDYISADHLGRRAIQNCLFDNFFRLISIYERQYTKLDSSEVLSAYCNAQLKIFKSFENSTFKAQSSIKTYFETIFRRECIDLLRKKSSIYKTIDIEKIIESKDESPDFVERSIEAEENNHRLMAFGKLMGMLTEKCKLIIQLYNYGHDFEKIAEELDYRSPIVARERFFQCKKRLITLYKEINAA
jgi:RNA polymerase sigma factor (sigma-70 family)